MHTRAAPSTHHARPHHSSRRPPRATAPHSPPRATAHEDPRVPQPPANEHAQRPRPTLYKSFKSRARVSSNWPPARLTAPKPGMRSSSLAYLRTQGSHANPRGGEHMAKASVCTCVCMCVHVCMNVHMQMCVGGCVRTRERSGHAGRAEWDTGCPVDASWRVACVFQCASHVAWSMPPSTRTQTHACMDMHTHTRTHTHVHACSLSHTRLNRTPAALPSAAPD